VRYLSLAEALVVAEAVTGIDVRALSRASRVELLDSALHAPQAGFGDEELYPSVAEKASVLVVRIASNHPLPDGNKRLAWQALTVFLGLNGYRLEVASDEAVNLMLSVAAGELGEGEVADWLRQHVDPSLADDQM